MAKRHQPQPNKGHEKVEELLQQAWRLTPSEIDSLNPGQNLNDVSAMLNQYEILHHPFSNRTQDEIENPHLHILRLMRQPDFFPFTCKHLFGKPDGSGPLELLPYGHIMLEELWNRQFPMVMATRGGAKSFHLGLYALLRLTFCQGSKFVIVASAFRQAKVVFEYMERIWHASPILRDLVGLQSAGRGRANGPRRDIDRCEFIIGDSVCIALPLGDGQKIRGLRASYVLAEEFASIPEDIYAVVVQGFGSVKADPVQNVKDYAQMKVLKRLGLWSNEMEIEEASRNRGNQAVLSGTCSFEWNHFSRYWREYKEIIETRGEKKKLEEIFKGPVPAGFNHRAYSIIRLPVELMPDGYMDEATLARAQVTTDRNLWLMEYGACATADTPIITDCGIKRLYDARVGDLVLTHNGRFRPVKKVTCRKWDGPIISLRTHGYNRSVELTPTHPFWNGNGWQILDSLDDATRLANLKELSGLASIDVADTTDEFLEVGEQIYPRPSQAKFTRRELATIRSSKKSRSQLAEEYDVRPGVIRTILTKQRRPKNAIPRHIALNYDFGLVLGYYAAEGSIGANGRAVGFALDGHVDKSLAELRDELCGACERVFGFKPKVYQRGSVANVTINQRLVANLMKYLCPGISHTKTVRSSILYSNPEFLQGFIVGYWHGDGHTPQRKDLAVTACSTSESLLSQLRVGLSYFGISASLIARKDSGGSIFRGTTYQNKPAFMLTLTGQNARRFRRKILGDTTPQIQGHKSKLSNTGEYAQATIASKTTKPFDGWVYNLEVEEDNSYSLPNGTVHNCICKDTEGFFKRSLIESCVVGKPDAVDPPTFPSCLGVANFSATIRGNSERVYIYGVDPASENDRFTIVIIEIWPDHRRVVYCWSTKKREHRAKLKAKAVSEHDFYRYCVRKLRDLMKVFPCNRMLIDAGGGGIAVREAFRDPDKLEAGELPVYEVRLPDDRKDTDDMEGHHLIEMVQFRDNNWVSEANYGMRKDMQDRVLLFPLIDPLALGLALEDDKAHGRVVMGEDGEEVLQVFDTLENCMQELEDLKTEMTTIVQTQTPNGLPRWDTPDSKQKSAVGASKKGRLRKDRYSALLIANMGARIAARVPDEIPYSTAGGFAHDLANADQVARKERLAGPMYTGPEWFSRATNGLPYGAVVRH